MMMISLKRLLKNWGVVQPAERVAVNHEVAGSSPATPAKDYKGEEMSDKTTKEVRGEIGQLRLRITELVDQMSDLQRDLRTFKEAVAEDIGRLNTKIVERRG